MSSTNGHREDQPVTGQHEQFDQEIRFGVTLRLGIALLVVTALAGAAMWGWFQYNDRRARDADVAPPAIVQSGQTTSPPGPRLQANPDRELAAMRNEEHSLIGSYRWVDRRRGIAQVPIDRAMALVVRGYSAAGAEPDPAVGGDAP